MADYKGITPKWITRDDFAPNIKRPAYPWYKRAWLNFTFWVEFRFMPVVYIATALLMLIYAANVLQGLLK